jgi:arylsulfatase A-like enzyme
MHALAPHNPYVARRDCGLRPPREWEAPFSTSARHTREDAYLEQVRCVTEKVEAAVRALAQSPARDNFVVIVHGDHGSRITRWDPNKENLGRFDDEDMVAGFSTLFALRGPGLQPGYDAHPAPVALLLRQWVEGDFRTQPVPEDCGTAEVYLTDWNWVPWRRHPLPRRWIDALAVEP